MFFMKFRARVKNNKMSYRILILSIIILKNLLSLAASTDASESVITLLNPRFLEESNNQTEGNGVDSSDNLQGGSYSEIGSLDNN